MNEVNFYNADKRLLFNEKRRAKSFIKNLFNKEGYLLQNINYIFCSDEYLLKINQSFLGHDYYTDVITFDLTETEAQRINAEVYVSLDRVKENAKTNAVIAKEELLRVLFHAALHLCGYGDKNKSEIFVMRKKEEQYLNLYGKTK